MRPPPVITLLTDFGADGLYAGAMKGVILSIQPEARIAEITHEAPAHDIRSAAFLLRTVYRLFPRGTIHVVVVDPGVGTSRRPLLLSTPEHHFVGPDNGVFTYVLESDEIRGCRVITASHYMREPVSPVFHGRDIFAPVAAYLARGVTAEMVGEEVEDPVRFEIPRPRLEGDRCIRASVLYVDRFGNVTIGLTQPDLEKVRGKSGASSLRLEAGGLEVTEVREHYEGADAGRPFFLFGSAGYLEVAANRASAAALTGLKTGDEIELRLS